MNLLTTKTQGQSASYQRVKEGLEMGRGFLMQGINLDERYTVNDREKKIQACDYYKKGIDAFKSAMKVNIMEIPEERRSEVREMKDKAKSNMKAAEDRFVELTNQMLGKTPSPTESRPTTSTFRATSTTAAEVRTTKKDLTRNGTEPSRCLKLLQPSPLTEFAHYRKTERVRAQSKSPISKTKIPPKLLASARQPVQKKETRSDSKATISRNQTSRPQRSVLARNDMLKGVDAKFGNAILDEILDKTEVMLKDVYGCDAAKQALEEAVIYPALNPSLFSGLRQPVKGILLFGPPGNGKTLLAKAVATESKQAFFNISASSLTSKWVGEGEKTVKALFQIAKNAQPAIIFIDEIDSILTERSDKEAESSRRMKTEFLIQFDGASSSQNDRILVIGATNRPYELDDAILRRFPKRIMLGLPDEKARHAIIFNTLKKHNADKGIRDRDLRYIASVTKGYSNSDLVNLCKEAAMVPVRRLGKDQLRTTTQHGLRPIEVSDFEEALRVIKPSTNGNHLQKMLDFTAQSGQM
ncbi:unnamed protein product, partial [Mesorhabditis belari]|uniref:microtubule-severing ATPase n=1 Tax=Mesorhabditis belari TaxID=2138241 RepID=A0AAF3EWW5_9BILA